MALDNNLVKKANQEESFTAGQIKEIMKCMDPETGYLHFARNYAYIQHPTRGRLLFEPYDYQIGLLESYHNNIRSVAMLPRQTGKALALDTPIPTARGWTTMGDIKVGDKILGADGNETIVTFATEVMHDRECYLVSFDNQETVVADAEHLWTVKADAWSESKTLTTREILEFKNESLSRVWIDINSPTEGKHSRLPADPYLFGSQLLKGIDYVPVEYKRSSIEQRLDLLRGAMDSSGFVDNQGTCKLHSKDQVVIDSFKEVLSSLGVKSCYDRNSGILSFKTDLCVFRKSCSKEDQKVDEDSKRHYITGITLADSVPVRCIQVDNKDHLFLCSKSMIPTHNTTCAAIYLTWYAMFVPDQTILIAAHKFTGAQEIMQRVRYVYEECPDFIRAGATSFNKGSIEFDNGSRIVSATTTETTGRGMSISLLYCDELAYVGTSVADEFISSIMPTLATGGKFIVTSTPNSDEDTFAQIWKAANDKFDEHGNEQEFGKNGFYPYFVPWDAHPDRDEQWKKERIAEIGEVRFRREFKCEFIIDEETLIAPDVLTEMTGIDPLFHTGEVRWYKRPKGNYTYAISLDPSMGTGGDYAAIQVFELPTYEQVAEWRSNTTAIPRQIRILRDVCSFIESECKTSNAIYWSVENNSIGEAALIVIDDFGEENIPGLFISEPVRKGHIRKFRKGFNTTHGTKISTCSRLKTLIDNKQFVINSKPFISELKTYISSGASYKAKQGTTDDLIAATLLAIRMMVVLKDWDPAIYNSFNQAAGMDEDWEAPMPIFVSSGLR